MSKHKSDPFTGKSLAKPTKARPQSPGARASGFDPDTGYTPRRYRRVWRGLDNIGGRRIA